ncbi:MAG TPA: glycoside hydrolase family 32 protein [Flavobacteriaceae bacterium]
MKRQLLLILCLSFFVACKFNNGYDQESSTIGIIMHSEEELYRPRFHFTPKTSWMNDPNGLVYLNGNYHLFYQYYPDSTVWGPMHWGHAKSKDLLQWEHRPIALYPDSLGYIFSGSAVIDKNDTSGFGKDAMVAMYTYHDPVKEKAGEIDFQTQGIAFSNDEGESWKKYENNPVIKNPGIRDFRDPKMFWNEEKSIWQMVLVAKDHVQFYESKNLKDWSKISEFKFEDNPPLGVWECPDLFKLKVDGTQEEKWVLIVSHGNGAPNGGSGTRYFVGDYDGTSFTTNQKTSRWVDYGTDNYAGVTFNNEPNDKRIFIGWMSNWNYATTTPTKTWRSAMTLPRELSLYKNNNQYYLKSGLLKGFALITNAIPENEITGEVPYTFSYDKLQESMISFDAEIQDSINIVLSNNNNEAFKISYNTVEGILRLDRSQSGQVDFNEKFKNSSIQTLSIGKVDKLSFKLVLDASSIEIFINDGDYVMTNQIFPTENYTSFRLNKEVIIKNFKINSISHD